MIRAAILLTFPFLPFALAAQHGWAFRAMPGFLAAHHEDMQAMNAHCVNVEVAREWKLDSSGGYLHKRQRAPYVGIGLNYIHLFNEISGRVYSASGYYDAGIAGNERTSFRVRLTVGVGYLTQQWDPFFNPRNRAIGSHINGLMQAACYMQTPLTPRSRLQAGLTLIHYSNGNWSQPNLGINMPALYLGIQQLEPSRRHIHTRISNRAWGKLEWQLSARLGKRQMTMDDPRNIWNYLVEGKVLYPHKPHRFWALGLVYYYDRSYLYTKFQPLARGGLDNTSEIAITGGHEYRIGKLGLIADLGFYLYRPSDVKRMYFECLGLKYYATPNLVFMNRIKVHLTTADFFEWGVAWQFSSKRPVKPGIRGGLDWIAGGFKPNGSDHSAF